MADADAGGRFPPVAVGRESGIGIGIELGNESGLDAKRDGARPTGTGLRGERTGGPPLRDLAFDAVETDVVAISSDGLRSAVIDCLDDALAEILGICFHGFRIASSQ